jgi:hypothetical protein
MGREKGSILQASVNCVLDIRIEVKRHTFVNSAVWLQKWSCFEKYHSVTNYKTIYVQFLQSEAQERNLQYQTVSKNILWGQTFKMFKTSGNWG